MGQSKKLMSIANRLRKLAVAPRYASQDPDDTKKIIDAVSSILRTKPERKQDYEVGPTYVWKGYTGVLRYSVYLTDYNLNNSNTSDPMVLVKWAYFVGSNQQGGSDGAKLPVSKLAEKMQELSQWEPPTR